MNLYIRVHGPIVLVTRVRTGEMNKALHTLSAQPVQGVVYETQGIEIPWGEKLCNETRGLIKYAKQSKRKFWCVSKDMQDEKIAQLPTLDDVWKEFHRGRI